MLLGVSGLTCSRLASSLSCSRLASSLSCSRLASSLSCSRLASSLSCSRLASSLSCSRLASSLSVYWRIVMFSIQASQEGELSENSASLGRDLLERGKSSKKHINYYGCC